MKKKYNYKRIQDEYTEVEATQVIVKTKVKKLKDITYAKLPV